MGRYELNDMVFILAPFGDGVTKRPITQKLGVNKYGEIVNNDILYFQYEVNDSFFIEDYLGV